MCGNDINNILAGTRVCMVVYSYYPMDQRVRREAESLSKSGAIIHVICLRNENETKFGIYNNIHVYRVPLGLRRNVGFLQYFFRYLIFLILSTSALVRLFAKHKYKVVHVHSIPDYLVFCAVVPKLFKVKIILDLHELMPEIFATKFDISMDSKRVGLVKFLERTSVRFSDFIITTSQIRKKTLSLRTQKKDIAIIMNLPQKDFFKTRDMRDFIEKNGLRESFIIIYVGGLYPERELDVVIKAMKYIEVKIPNIKFVICGTGGDEYVASLHDLIKDLNLEKKVLFVGYVPQDDVLNYIDLSDVAICPYRFYPKLGDVLDGVSSTKVFEYLLVPKPVIVSNTSATNEEFKDLVSFYESGDHKNLGDRLYEVYKNGDEFNKMAKKAQEVLFKRYDPEKNEQKFLEIYKNLITR
ncbi:MAG: glycosyltransferase family 4 protein [Thermoplasmata archaeon]|nr:MAG: glycosyltransferase family 4 protein [Thermoplasmata archaeon]